MTFSRRRLLALALACVAVYALLWIGYVLQWNWLVASDAAALEAAHRFGASRPGWVTGWDVFCTLLGPTAFRLVTLVVIVVALVRRHLRVAMFLLISVELAGLVTEVAKAAADRPRPDTALVIAPSTSFPSGHALGVMVAVAALLTIIWPVVKPSLRGWLVGLGAVIVIAIGVGRVVLNVHHPSDVLAGWALGAGYFAICLLLVAPRRPVTTVDETPAAPDNAQ
ncbi:phosphatase PAP2 family protein [Mycolicibacterium sp. XJ1819]